MANLFLWTLRPLFLNVSALQFAYLKNLLEVTGIFMACFVTLETDLHDHCILIIKNLPPNTHTHEIPVNLGGYER